MPVSSRHPSDGDLQRRLVEVGADVVVSLGSGSLLVEWLLAVGLNVVCVDSYYTPSDTGPW
eukprot:2750314-Amphidinium_carterae.1